MDLAWEDMSEAVRTLFREMAGLKPAEREKRYARRQIPLAVRAEVESLLDFDATHDLSLAGVIKAAAGQLWPPDGAISVGARCGPYRLIRLLGTGGMGSVYLAERADGELEQRVAIKVLRAGPHQAAFHDRFLRERQILASMNHPGIARLLDVGHSDGRPYLVMEFVDGVRIDEYAAQLNLREIVTLFLCVAEAVSYAHRNLIIHRDLKPSNILVNAAGEPKLLDFGIAKIVDEPEQTRTIDRMLTPGFASPEQLRGDAQTTATDIYSLGAVLSRLLTGRHRGQELPKDLAAIVAKATREEPGERYPSVDQLIAELKAYLDHRPVEARRGNAFYLARRFVRRRWLSAAAVALALAGIALALWAANRERAVAERRFQQVRQLSLQFLDLDNEIRALPGATKARKRIVSASLDYLARLGAETRPGRDKELDLEIATAYLRVARVQGVPINSNLGQFDEARRSLERADSLVEPLLATRHLAASRAALLLSAEISRDAMILADSEKRTAEALRLARKSVSRLEALLASPGATPDDSFAAARIYINVALGFSNMHHFDEASTYARRAVAILRETKREPRQLGRALGVLANTLRFTGRLEEALAAIRESRAMAERWADPENGESLLHLSSACWREGLILGEWNSISLGRPREALPLLQKAYDVAESAARKDPVDYTSRSYVSMAGRELGDVLRESDPARALAVYDHTRRRVAEIKNNSKARREDLWLLAGSSYALRRLGRIEEARLRIEAALAILADLKMYPAASVALGEEADNVLRALADHYAATGHTRLAINAYLDLLAKVRASQPQPESDLRQAHSLARLYRDLEQIERRAGNRADAATLEQQRLNLWREWDRKLPDNSFIRRQLDLPLR